MIKMFTCHTFFPAYSSVIFLNSIIETFFCWSLVETRMCSNTQLSPHWQEPAEIILARFGLLAEETVLLCRLFTLLISTRF